MYYFILGVFLPTAAHLITDDTYHGKFSLTPDATGSYGILKDKDGDWAILNPELEMMCFGFVRKHFESGVKQRFIFELTEKVWVGHYHPLAGKNRPTKCFLNNIDDDFFRVHRKV